MRKIESKTENVSKDKPIQNDSIISNIQKKPDKNYLLCVAPTYDAGKTTYDDMT